VATRAADGKRRARPDPIRSRGAGSSRRADGPKTLHPVGMRFATSLLFVICWVACGDRAPFQDFTSAVGAARSFVEAGRANDAGYVRAALVADERDQHLLCDYSTIGGYELTLARAVDADHAVVLLRSADLALPLACVREAGSWRVSVHDSLALRREPTFAAPPR